MPIVALAMAVAADAVPAEYQGKAMPAGFAENAKVLAVGKAIYEGKLNPEVNCAKCHGTDGKPTKMGRGAHNLSEASDEAQHADAEWFWRVSEGKPGSKMPSYKTRLTEEQRWQVLAYMRSFARK